MSKLKFNERDYKDVQLMQLAEQIHTKMGQDTTLFPAPVPELAVLQSALAAFRKAATDASSGDRIAIKVRNQKRNELVYVLKELAKYVDTVAKDDDIVVLAAGFDVQKTRSSYRGLVPKAQPPIAEPAEVGSGRISLKTNPWPGARMYQFQYRIKGSGDDWSTQLSTRSFCVVSGLEMFHEYEFRVSYVGLDPTPNYSDISSSYVL